MKRIVLMGFATAALVAGGLAVAYNASKPSLTPLQLENLEALADEENITSKDCPGPDETECFRVFKGNKVHIFFEKK